MPSDLLLPKQAAALAGVSKVALWKAQRRGEIRAATTTTKGALYTRQTVKEWKALRKRRRQRLGNPPRSRDKTGTVYLEGIHQSFSLWHRKLSGVIPKWGEPEITRALDLLAPVVKLWIELEQRQRPFREQRKVAQAEARKRREAAHLSAVSD